MKAQKGIIALTAIMLMIIAGAFILSTSIVSTTTTRSSTNRMLSKQAYYIAEAGLERGKLALLSTDTSGDPLSERYDCSSISFSTVSYGEGEFTVTGTDHLITTSLSSGITSGDSIIPVTSIAGLAENGKVQINSEYIDYVGTSTSSGVCGGSAPCLINAIRGVDGSLAASHSLSDSVNQDACLIASIGAVPTIANPRAQRTNTQLVLNPPPTTDNIWAVGDDSGADEYIAQGDGSAWSLIGPSGSIDGRQLYSVHFASDDFGIAVGDDNSGEPLIVHYNSGTWSQQSTSLPNQELFSVHCVDENNCYAVGDNDGSDAFAAYWNGATWSQMSTGALPNVDLNDIHCVSTSFCIAVGDRQGGSGLVARWNGSTWSRMTFSVNRNVEAVFCNSTSNCWTGNDRGEMMFYNGSTWSGALDDIGPAVRDITCVATDDCWTSGNNRSALQHFNGTNWNAGAGAGSLPNVTYGGIDCIATDNCWAVGDNSSGAVTVKWNGSTWSRITAGSLPNRDLNDVDIVSAGGAIFTIQTAPWVENFH